MAAKDLVHDAVKRALEKDGWTITDDPLFLRFGGLEMYIDSDGYLPRFLYAGIATVAG
ncbi:element excision factor XisH family protein [Nodosilinea nodulosa]|uniref:element excision factor XisH family protein n=1 Tax=Nodosilinea nodulosa TaxID=416001 RepID=UPI0030F3F0B9